MDGLLLLDKPAGMTSRRVVDEVEAWFPGVRIGHAGTLDPLATGLLVLALGPATRLIEYVQRMKKTYRAGVRLGARSDTDDADGTVQPVAAPPVPTEDEVRRCLAAFVGEIDQVPPAHSAAHVGGQRAYTLARQGQAVRLAPRRVAVYAIHLVRYAFPDLEILVECSKGAYIRALARDIGERLGCGGLIATLQRTATGPFRVEDALPLDAGPAAARARLLPAKAAVAELPAVTLDAEELRRLRQGQRLTYPPRQRGRFPAQPAEVAVFAADGTLAAIATWHPEGALRPHKVL
jgi:tRNA pseudouridine55 synthase